MRHNPGQNISRLVKIDQFLMFHPPTPQINVVFLLPTPGMVPVIIQHIPTHSKITTTLILGGGGGKGGAHGMCGCADYVLVCSGHGYYD